MVTIKVLKKIDSIILWGSIILFCALSLVIYYYTPGLKAHFEGDSVRYFFIAHHIAELTKIPLEVLGYPFFLSILCYLWDSVLIIVLAQILTSILSLLVLRHIIKQLSDCVQVLIACTFFWALNIGFLIYTQLLLIEIILAFLFLLFIDRIIAYYQQPSLSLCAQAAFVLGISILFRPAALFYALFFAVLLLFITKISWQKRVISLIVFLILFYVPIVSYMVLNYYYFGRFIICPVMNINLFAFYYPKLQAAFSAHAIPASDYMLAVERDIAQEHITSATQANLIRLCLQQPVIGIGIWLVNMIKSFLGLYQTQWKLYFELADKATSYFCLPGNLFTCLGRYIHTGTNRWWLQLLGWYELVYLIIEYLSVAVGILLLWAKRKYWLLVFAVSFVWYFAFITGPDGSGRFRMMLEPWFLILAALGVCCLVMRDKKMVLV